MILPINPKPYLKSYAHHAFVDAIISAEEYCGKRKAEISLSNMKSASWEFYVPYLQVEKKEETLIFEASPFETDTEGIIWRTCKKNDEIIIGIDYFQKNDLQAVIALFVCEEEPVNSIHNNKGVIKYLYQNDMGVFWYQDHTYYSRERCLFDYREYPYLKLCIEENTISFQYSKDLEAWQIYKAIQTDSSIENQYIGLNVYFGRAQYYDYLFSNYIQTFGKVNHPILHLDYYLCNPKNGSYHWVHPLVDFRRDGIRQLSLFGNDIYQYTKVMNEMGYYIEVYLDEYYIKETNSYQKKHFLHQSLVYGVEGEDIHALVYGKNNILISRVLTLREYREGYTELAKNEMIKLIMYAPASETYSFNKERFIGMLDEYLDSCNSSRNFDILLPVSNMEFGIDYISKFADASCFDLFLRDYRVVYLLYERELLMKERILFLYDRRIIQRTEGRLLTTCETILDKVEWLKKHILRYQFCSNKNEEKEQILQKLKRFILEGRDFYRILRNALILGKE